MAVRRQRDERQTARSTGWSTLAGGLVATVCLAIPLAARAQTNNSYPMLMSLKPAAAQVGATTEHELSARYNLAGATRWRPDLPPIDQCHAIAPGSTQSP